MPIPLRAARLPRSLQIGWAAGSAGSTTILYLVNILYLYFMVAYLGVPPVLAGTVMLVIRLYDAGADLAIGLLSDRTRSRWGRRRPWMALGAVLSTLAMAMLFLPAVSPTPAGVSAQSMVILALLFTGYSAFAIPASAMAVEMTDSYDGRTSLMAYRTFFIQVAGLIGAAGAPALVAALGGTAGGYAVMGVAMAAFVGVTMAISVVATARARTVIVTAAARRDRSAIAGILGNRPFVLLMAAKFCGFMATSAFGAVGLFFMRDIAGQGEAGMSRLSLISAIAGTVTVPVWRLIARGMLKERVYIAALILATLSSLSWFLVAPGEPFWLFLVRALCLGAASTGTVLMAMAMLPDAIENDVRRTGLRREGLYAALFEFLQKAAFAVGPFLVGLFLQVNGYQAGRGGTVVQSAEALHAVRLTIGALPSAAYLTAIGLLLFYRTAPARASEDGQ